MHNTIHAYIINLKRRIDRRKHIVKEFVCRPEFSAELVEACEHTNGAIGLWKSICKAVSIAERKEKEFILICEDDHQFTEAYDKSYLLACVEECRQNEGDVLLGSVSWFDSAMPISDNLHWVSSFTGTQFMIIFKKFYRYILSANFTANDNADHKIASITNKKFFMSKPISRQVYFGYSDITARNGLEGRLEELFDKSKKGIQMINDVYNYYRNEFEESGNIDQKTDFTDLIIPVYVIIPSALYKKGIAYQFSEKQEFDVNFIEVNDPEVNDNVNTWNGIRRIIEQAKKNDDDVIVICDKDHSFTASYSKEYLFSNVIAAHYQGADILLTGCKKFHRAFPVAPSRYWIAEGVSLNFLIIYKKFFETILAEPFDEEVKPEELINEMTFNKMLLYPFISTAGKSEPAFEEAINKLSEVDIAAAKYYWKK